MKRRFSSSAARKRKGGRTFSKKDGMRQRRLWRPLLCAVLLLALVLGKLILPEGFPTRAKELLTWNVDVEAVFSALGRAAAGEQKLPDTLQDVYTAVFSDSLQKTAALQQESLAQALTYRLEDGSALQLLLPLATETVSADMGDAGMTESSYVYTEENLPQKVSMFQKILGLNYTAPTQGELTSAFGYRDHPIYGEEQFHYGIDIANESGTEILAFADGTVQAVGESSQLGKYLMVSHANQISSLYAHCSRIEVSQGEVVKKGTVIAKMGSTGISTGPHLHFEVHMDGIYLNPIYYVDLAG